MNLIDTSDVLKQLSEWYPLPYRIQLREWSSEFLAVDAKL